MPSPGKVAFSFATGLVSVLLLLACSWLVCSRNAAAQNPLQASPSVAVNPAAFSSPLELIRDKPHVSVMVNGRGPFRFLIDTGTGGQALVSPELANELALPVVGHVRLMDPSGKGEQRSDILQIHWLKVAGRGVRGDQGDSSPAVRTGRELPGRVGIHAV